MYSRVPIAWLLVLRNHKNKLESKTNKNRSKEKFKYTKQYNLQPFKKGEKFSIELCNTQHSTIMAIPGVQQTQRCHIGEAMGVVKRLEK